LVNVITFSVKGFSSLQQVQWPSIWSWIRIDLCTTKVYWRY